MIESGKKKRGARMWKKLFTLLFCCSASLYGDGLQSDIDNATTTLREMAKIPEGTIPSEILKNAQGLVILRTIKAGAGISGMGGTGIVLAKTVKGWSAPSAVGVGGAGIGIQIGAEVNDLVLILNSRETVDKFAKMASLSLGIDVSAAAGPVGRTLEAGVVLPKQADVYSYSLTKGLFMGISLEQTVFAVRNEANETYYKKPVTASELLSGKVPPPAGAKSLYQELNKDIR